MIGSPKVPRRNDEHHAPQTGHDSVPDSAPSSTRTAIRAFPVLLWDFDVDEPFCTGCHACERACPVECMTATMMDNPKYAEGTSKRKKILDEFYIDYGRCMRCNICVEVCNFDAIAMNNTWSGHELSTFDRKDLILDTDQLMVLSKSQQIRPWLPS